MIMLQPNLNESDILLSFQMSRRKLSLRYAYNNCLSLIDSNNLKRYTWIRL